MVGGRVGGRGRWWRGPASWRRSRPYSREQPLKAVELINISWLVLRDVVVVVVPVAAAVVVVLENVLLILLINFFFFCH